MPSPRNELSAVIFDLDGTLIDSAPSILETFRRVLSERGLKPQVPLSGELIGPPLHETLRRLVGANGSVCLDDLIVDFRRIYDDSACLAARPYPGVEALLETLHNAGVRLFVATNKRNLPTRKILDHLGWMPLFDKIFALDVFRDRVADKLGMIRVLMAECNIDSRLAIFVGDTEEDRLAANVNGLKFVGAGWGYGKLSTEQNGDLVVPASTQMIQYLGAVVSDSFRG